MRTVSGAAPRVTIALVIVLAGVLTLTAASCQSGSTGIGLGHVTRADVTETVEASATVTARAVAVLTAPTDGTLASLAVQPGQTVSAGQILAVVDSPSAQQRLTQATSALAALRGGGGGAGGVSRASLVAAQQHTDQAAATAFSTARDAAGKIADPSARAALLTQISSAELAYRDAAATSAALIASLQRGLASIGQAVSALTSAQRAQAQAAYDLAKSTVDALTLRAPVSGVVQQGGAGSTSSNNLSDLLGSAAGGGSVAAGAGALSAGTGGTPSGPGVDPAVAVGAQVGAGTPVVTVVDTSQLGLLAEVDETDVLLVEPGISAEVELDAVPGARYAATVGSVDVLPTTSGSGGVSYRVRLTLGAGQRGEGGAAGAANAAPTPKPGMSAVAHLAVRSARGAVTVPVTAVFNSGGHDAVWLVHGGKAVRTPVTVGVAGADLEQITVGVAEGDQIVVRGTDRVHNGQKLP